MRAIIKKNEVLMRTINNSYFNSGKTMHTHIVGSLDNVFHKHTFFELFYITEGHIEHTVNKDSSFLNPGDMFLLRPEDSHCFMRINETEPFCLHRDILIPTEIFKKLCDFISPSLYEFIMKSPAPLFAHLDNYELNSFETDFSLFQNTAHIQFSQYTLTSPNALLVKILYKFLQYEQEKISMPNWIAELMKDLNNPEYFSMEVNEILGRYSYNYSYACRCFKKYTGTNIVNFFLASKMNFALSLLQFSNKSITEISILSGFSSINYFNRIFKKTYGVSPSQYRKSTF